MSEDTYLGQDHGEGYFSVENYKLFYRRFGEGEEVVLCLHGGPGMPHDYLAPLSQHGSDEFTVYLYDQFGVGRSDRPAAGDFDRYTVEHYRDEVDEVRKSIGAEKVHVYGQSWGGMLALEYALEYQEHVQSLILANTLVDSESAHRSMRSVIDELPEEAQETIQEHESRRNYEDPDYLEALDLAYREHVCRSEEYPQPVADTFDRINTDVYGLMWGPNEYVLLDEARLRDWDVRDRLNDIRVPTLVLTGRYDEISPEIARQIEAEIPNAKLVEFEDSSHMPFWEQPDDHYDEVESYLQSNKNI